MRRPRDRSTQGKRSQSRLAAGDRPAPDEAAPARAKVFWNGRSQAIRLPKQLRVSSPEVIVYKLGGRIVIEEPSEELDELGWPVGFWDLFGALDRGFDVGERDAPHERDDPLGTGRRG